MAPESAAHSTAVLAAAFATTCFSMGCIPNETVVRVRDTSQVRVEIDSPLSRSNDGVIAPSGARVRVDVPTAGDIALHCASCLLPIDTQILPTVTRSSGSIDRVLADDSARIPFGARVGSVPPIGWFDGTRVNGYLVTPNTNIIEAHTRPSRSRAVLVTVLGVGVAVGGSLLGGRVVASSDDRATGYTVGAIPGVILVGYGLLALIEPSIRLPLLGDPGAQIASTTSRSTE